jgi:hypothetical protein
MTPETEETLLEYGVVVIAEVAEEAAQDITLLISEIGHVVEFVEVAEIGKDTVGRCHILVYVIEVGHKDLPPSIEMVEGLVNACTLCEAFMKVADQLDRIGHMEAAVLPEEFTDGNICRTPDGPPRQPCEIFIKKERGALVGKHHRDTRKVGTIVCEQVFCHIFQKCLHFTSSILLL